MDFSHGWRNLVKIEKNDTWDLVDLPKGKDVIGVKWVYKTKYNVDGKVEKLKARLVAKGKTIVFLWLYFVLLFSNNRYQKEVPVIVFQALRCLIKVDSIKSSL